MFWLDTETTQPITTEKDLALIERMLGELVPVNVRLRQLPRLIASLRQAWRTVATLQAENAELRKRLRTHPLHTKRSIAA